MVEGGLTTRMLDFLARLTTAWTIWSHSSGTVRISLLGTFLSHQPCIGHRIHRWFKGQRCRFRQMTDGGRTERFSQRAGEQGRQEDQVTQQGCSEEGDHHDTKALRGRERTGRKDSQPQTSDQRGLQHGGTHFAIRLQNGLIAIQTRP